jgi:hypothetical protein
MRLRLFPTDFEFLFNMFKESSVGFHQHVKETIDLQAENVRHPSHVSIKYLPALEEYSQSDSLKVEPTEVGRLRSRVKWFISHPKGEETTLADLVRPMEKPFIFRDGTVPDELDTDYLFAIYESIKEWGYADGPFYGEIISAFRLPDGQIQTRSAHRVAALLHLGYTKVDAFVTDIK